MALYSWSVGDLITAARQNAEYNLLKGVGGGTDTLTLINGTTLDATLVAAGGILLNDLALTAAASGTGITLTDITAPAAPGAGKTRLYTVAGVPHYRASGGSDTAFGVHKELGSATATSTQTVTSTATPGTDLTGLTVTCTPDGAHPVYVDFVIPNVTQSTTQTIVVAIQKDGAVVQTTVVGGVSTNNSQAVGHYRDAAPTNASHIYKLSAWSGSAQTINFNMSATEIGSITVTQEAT